MKNRVITVLLTALIILFSVLPQAASELQPLYEISYPDIILEDDYDRQEDLKINYALDQNFKASFEDFCFMTTSQVLGDRKSNTNFSPMSLYLALAMTGSGANGKTRDEILNLLGVKDDNFLTEQCYRLYNLAYKDNNISTCKIANSIWINRNTMLKDAFLKITSMKYYAEAFKVNFSDPMTESLMGTWVSQKTNGAIIPKIENDPEQIMSLFNTVHFADEWNEKFYPLEQEEAFYTDNKTVMCNYIGLSEMGSITQGDNFIRVRLRLKGNGSMIFILPDETTSVNALLKAPDSVREIFTGGFRRSGQINYKIPVFGFDNSLELTNSLQFLGMERAFTSDADFSAMTNSFLQLSRVTQDTHISIDEKGVVASAFTSVKPDASAGPALDDFDIMNVTLDRPFIYGILSNDGMLYFTGAVTNPSGT